MQEKIELESTYLAREIPEEILAVPPIRLEDTYFPEDPAHHAQLRVRKMDDTYEITKKVPVNEGDASVSLESSISITQEEYASISQGSRRKIVKDRYETVIDGYRAEVDVFKGTLEGLVLIDFEFTSIAEKDAFKKPECCLADVTQVEFLAGGVLSSLDYETIARRLGRFGYTSIAGADTSW